MKRGRRLLPSVCDYHRCSHAGSGVRCSRERKTSPLLISTNPNAAHITRSESSWMGISTVPATKMAKRQTTLV